MNQSALTSAGTVRHKKKSLIEVPANTTLTGETHCDYESYYDNF